MASSEQPTLQRVAVLGSGTMGAGIAYLAALAGLETNIFDRDPSAMRKAVDRVARYATIGRDRGTISDKDAERIPELVTTADDPFRAVADCGLVIEAIVEDLDAKRSLLSAIEPTIGPAAIIATNTSALSVTAIMRDLSEPSRALGLHFFNPVPSMRLCEVVVGQHTSGDTLQRALAFVTMIGKESVTVRDSPGFATSRFNAVISNEAFRMLETDLASAEDIDRAVRLGLNHPMGPFELIDLVGLDVRLAVIEELWRKFGDGYRPTELHRRLVSEGRLGRKTGHGVYRYDAPA